MLDVIITRLSDWYSILLLLSIGSSMFSLAKLMQQEQRNADMQKWSKTSEGKFSFLILVISGFSLYGKVLGLSIHNLDPLPLPLLIGDYIFIVFLIACTIMMSRWIDLGISKQ